MTACKPLEGKPLTFWHVAGDLIWRGDGRPVPISFETAVAMRDLYEEEASVAFVARDMKAARQAAALWAELGEAMDGLDTYRRVLGCAIAPFTPLASPVSEIIDGLSRRFAA